jgi:hypothetical protein
VEKILGGNIPRVMGDRPDEGPVVRPKSTEDPFSDPARLCDSRDCQQVMTRLSLLLAVILPLTFQSTTSSPIRLGPTGDRLTADDLEQIRRLDFGGRAVWVLVGQPRGFEPSNSWYVNAYLDPDHVRADIRRGRIAVLKAEMTSPDAYDGPKSWALASMLDYAQVPVSTARPDAIAGGRDLNRPFRIVGTFDDDSLVAIVSFIRSGPILAVPLQATTGAPPAGIFRQVEKSWPISSVVQQANAAEVSLLRSPYEKSGQTVILRKEGTSWTVTHLGAWFAD